MTNGAVVLGVPVDNVSMDETLLKIEEFLLEGSFHQVATANVDYLVNAVANAKYKEILCKCDLVIADGMPVVLASRLLGSPLRERVSGADLVPRLAGLSRQRGYGIFLLGASPGVSELAARRMEDMGARIVGRLSPPIRPLAEFDNDAILAEIEKASPHILLVAFGSPKQELWIDQNRDRLRVPVCIGVGGSLDFLAGVIPRAPGWIQRVGLEWAYRIWAEPRRLAGRYAKDALWMARYFSVQLALSLASRRRGHALQIGVDSIGSVNILSATGMMTGSRLAQFERTAFTLADRGGALVVELTGVSHLGADGTHTLTGLLRVATSRGCRLWLAGMPPALRERSRRRAATGCLPPFLRFSTPCVRRREDACNSRLNWAMAGPRAASAEKSREAREARWRESVVRCWKRTNCLSSIPAVCRSSMPVYLLSRLAPPAGWFWAIVRGCRCRR